MVSCGNRGEELESIACVCAREWCSEEMGVAVSTSWVLGSNSVIRLSSRQLNH